MSYQFYIGADVSKLTIDFTILREGCKSHHYKIENNKKSIQGWLKIIMKEHKAGGQKSLFCIEHMGPYANPLVEVLISKKLKVWLETPLHIKLSLGLQRGKDDKADSRRIAQYAFLNFRTAKLWIPPRTIIERLKLLRSLRNRLIKSIGQLDKSFKEREGYMSKDFNEEIALHCQESLAALKANLLQTNLTIKKLIMEDDYLSKLFQWTTSVPGIGAVIATELIIVTNEFKKFSSPKKFACYCGVAPFAHSSGTSLNTKAKVSKAANAKMRTLLFMASICTSRSKGEIGKYFERKVAEGHPKMSVLNAIRNKLIHRIFACVKEKREYTSHLDHKS